MAVLVVTRYFAALVAAASVLAARPCWAQERISVQDFKAGIENGLYDVVFDVRSQAEWDTGHIPGAIHFPLDSILEADNPSNWHAQQTAIHDAYSCDKSCATIVTYCAVGGRASTAINRLRELGFQGTLLNGQGTSQWVAAGYELTQEDDEEEETAPTKCATMDICPANEPTAASEEAAPSQESSSSMTFWGVATAMLATASTTAALLLLPSSPLLLWLALL